ncbi:MAG TPA: CBS domain-containing protein [Vicinamibacterales bacterium]|nr:CBS domain-containing protein [Vicinamibacterales bacterium]
MKEQIRKHASDVMTPNPARCSSETTLDQIARLMVEYNCGEIVIVDVADTPVGVITDRDIVCRIVAEGKNPMGYPALSCMSEPVITVSLTATLDEIVGTMETHQVRRLPVVDADGSCVGMIALADLVSQLPARMVSDLLEHISRVSLHPSS